MGEKLVEIKFTILAMEKQILFKKVFIMDIFPTYNQVENNKMNPKVYSSPSSIVMNISPKKIFLIIEVIKGRSAKEKMDKSDLKFFFQIFTILKREY